jgi:chaperonin GroES
VADLFATIVRELSIAQAQEHLRTIDRYRSNLVTQHGATKVTQRVLALNQFLASKGAEIPEVSLPGPCRLRPLADHVVIRPVAPKTTTEGGLLIPETAQEVPMRGEVLAVGPGAFEPNLGTRPIAVNVGDEVLFGRYAGLEVELDGEQVRIMREEDLLGTLAPEVQ